MDNARTTSNRLRTENQELKTETKELKKELGKMKDLFNSEQLEALRHHFPNISKAMEEGKDLLKQITRSRGFGMVCNPAPKGGATKRQPLNGVLRRSDSEEILQGSENGCVLILKSLWCGARRDGWSRPLPLGAPRPMIFK